MFKNLKDYFSRELILQTFSIKKTDQVANFDLLRNKRAVEFYAGKRLDGKNNLKIVTGACRKILDLTRTIRVPIDPPVQIEENGFVKMYAGWTSWIVERPFGDYQSFQKWVKLDVQRLNRWFPDVFFLEKIKNDYELKQNLLGDTVLMWTEAEGWFYGPYNEAGMEYFSYLWYDDPVLFSEWIEQRFRQKKIITEVLVDAEKFPIAFIGEDIACKTGLIFSPWMLEKEFFPRLKCLIDVFNEKGVKVVFHSDGNLMEVIDQIIATGANGLHPIEPIAGMDLEKVRAICPEEMILLGNLDCSQLLPFGSRKEIEQEVKRIVDLAKSTGNIIFSSSSELHDEIPLENIICMFEIFETQRKR